MPYDVTRDHRACPVSKPWAVVKKGDRGEPLGCYASEEKAKQQLSALYASENPRSVSMRASEQDREDANLDVSDAGELNAAARRVAADRDWAMDDGSYPIRPRDQHGEADLDKAINAVGRGEGSHDAIRRHIMARAEAIGLSGRVPDNWGDDGSLTERAQPWTANFTRAFPLEDIRIRGDADGDDGRTVEAYATAFDTPAEIRDQDGHYMEAISRSAFNRTLSQNGTNFQVLYNHGMTLHGTPSERASTPIGKPLEIRPDGRGLYTVTRYNRTQLAEEVLESIRSGEITGQSFSGRFIHSDPPRVPRRGRSQELPTVTRTEVALREYGPTPFPSYQEASVMGVRALFERLDEQSRAELMELLNSTSTSRGEPAAEDSLRHSGRLTIARNRIRAEMQKAGVYDG